MKSRIYLELNNDENIIDIYVIKLGQHKVVDGNLLSYMITDEE